MELLEFMSDYSNRMSTSNKYNSWHDPAFIPHCIIFYLSFIFLHLRIVFLHTVCISLCDAFSSQETRDKCNPL